MDEGRGIQKFLLFIISNHQHGIFIYSLPSVFLASLLLSSSCKKSSPLKVIESTFAEIAIDSGADLSSISLILYYKRNNKEASKK
jgi:hypothetical protein